MEVLLWFILAGVVIGFGMWLHLRGTVNKRHGQDQFDE